MKDEFLKYAPPFAGLTDSEREALGNGFTQGEAGNGTAIFRAGDKADALYMIAQGFVRVATEAGQVLATLGPGSILGDAALFRGAPHEVTATAVSPVQYWMLGDRALRDLVVQQPAIGIKLGQNVEGQIVQMEEYLVWRLSKTAELQGLPQNTLQAVAAQLRPYPLPAGQALFRAGEPPTGIGFLESGAMEMRSEGEPPQPVAQGAILGALALLTNKPYSRTAFATEDSLVWALSADNFHAVNSRHPGLRRSLARAMRGRLSRADQAQAVSRLQQMPLFAEVPQAVVQTLVQRMVLQHVPAGDRVYRVGEAGDALFLVEQGEIELTAENAQGIIEEKARIGANGFFGEMSVLSGQVRVEDATATRNTNLWILSKADLQAVAAQNPPLDKALNQALATRLAATAAPEVDNSRFRSYELLSGLSATELRQVIEYLRPTRYRAGETICRINAPADMMYFLERGQVRIQPISGGSYILGPGDEFGERALLSNQPHNATALAETDADIWTLSRTDFSLLTSRAPSVAINLSRLISQRLGQPAQNMGAQAGTAPQFAPGQMGPGQMGPAVQQPPIMPQAGNRGAPPYARGGIPQPGMQQPGMAQGAQMPPGGYAQGAEPYAQPGAPVGQQAPRSRMQAAQAQEYADYEDYPLANPPRQRSGGFGGLSTFSKIILVVLAILVIWVIVVVVLQLTGVIALGRQSTVEAASPEALSAVIEKGSYNVALDDAALAQALAAADQLAAPTPTWTPYPTATPLAQPTPEPARGVVGVAYTTDLMNLAPPDQPQVAQAAAPAEPEAAPAAPAAAAVRERALDPRLPALGVTIDEAQVAPGEQYWRLIEVRFADEQESAGKHHIYVDALDESGNRVVGQPVTVYWGDGNYSAGLEDKPAPDFGFNYQMYASGYAYSVKVEGLPSDVLKGAGMGDLENRFHGIHTSYYLVFQRATR